MDTLVDGQGMVWFSEAAAGFIGRFDPRTEQFTQHPLPWEDGHTPEPQDLQMDESGKLWFVEHQGTQIGRLDPRTGALRIWPIHGPAAGESVARPFSLAVTLAGGVWFGMAGPAAMWAA
jgi:streptogramin lyase